MFLVVTYLLLAQTNGPTRADIEKLIQVSGSDAQLKKMTDFQSLRTQMSVESMTPDTRKEIERFIDVAAEETAHEFQLAKKELMERMIQIYSSEISRDDVQALIEFFEGPLGQRILGLMKRLESHEKALSMEWGQKIQQTVMPRVTKRLLDEKLQVKP